MKYAFKKRIYILAAFIFDLFGNILFFPFRIVRKQVPSKPKKILVTRLDHIGDFVSTTPLFKNLKKNFPDAEVTVLLNSASKELAYRDPNIDKVITFSPRHLARGGNSEYTKGLRRIIKDVKNIGFDLGIEPRGDILSILIMWLGRVKYRIGYGITGGGFLLHNEEKYNNNIHVIDRNLALLRVLNIPVEDRAPDVYYNEKDKETVEGLLREIKWDKKLIVLHPFAGAPAREWARDNVQGLIDGLKSAGISTLLIGTDKDRERYSNVIDMRGKFNLPQLAYFIKRIGFFIGLDSGPANIAAALDIRSIVISSGTNIIEHWIPNNGNVRFVYKSTVCRPCERAVCPKDRHECMEDINIEEIVRMASE